MVVEIGQIEIRSVLFLNCVLPVKWSLVDHNLLDHRIQQEFRQLCRFSLSQFGPYLQVSESVFKRVHFFAYAQNFDFPESVYCDTVPATVDPTRSAHCAQSYEWSPSQTLKIPLKIIGQRSWVRGFATLSKWQILEILLVFAFANLQNSAVLQKHRYRGDCIGCLCSPGCLEWDSDQPTLHPRLSIIFEASNSQ